MDPGGRRRAAAVIDLARPGFLWAGALLTLGPLILHLLRPVERSRKVLPTSRFLTPDPKRRVRLHRMPDERTLLLLRMLLCLLLGAAFAGVGWVGAERGVATLVVVDGGGAMRDDWARARDVLVGQLDGRSAHVVIVRPTSGALPDLERLEADIPSEPRWAELSPGIDDGNVRLAHLLRAVRTAAERTVGYDSIAAMVLTDPSWRAWSAGSATLRERLWPGRIRLVVPAGRTAPEGGAAGGEGARAAPLTVALRAPPALRRPFAEALSVLGATVDTTVAAPSSGPDTSTGLPGRDTPGEIILSVGPDADGWDGLWLAGERDAGAPPHDAFLLLDGRTFPGAGSAPGGTPAPGTTVSLLRVGGRPAAAARRADAGCRVVLPLDPEAPITGSADLPLVLEGVLEAGCGVLPEPPGAEAAFRRLLEEGSYPATVATAEIRDAGAGRPLGRWILLLALLIAVAETWTSRGIEARRHGRD